MRKAIAEAQVGDDVFGDDPSVNMLEQRVASLFGAEAALFVPSGTMGNHVALSSITSPGDEVVLDRQAHIFNNEVAAAAALLGVQFNALDGMGGVITAEQIEPHIRRRNLHHPVSRVIAIENTHNRAGGAVFPLEELRRIRKLADAHGLDVHLDGARIANAVVSTGIGFDKYYEHVDTLSMCFSKGLGAPVGSIVVSDAAKIAKARKRRKMFGGGMRQAGVLAAAAIYALDHHIDRLAEDHAHARTLGEAVAATDGLELEYPVATNMVFVRVGDRWESEVTFINQLKEHGILAGSPGPGIVRLVTHHDVSAGDVEYVAGVLANL